MEYLITILILAFELPAAKVLYDTFLEQKEKLFYIKVSIAFALLHSSYILLTLTPHIVKSDAVVIAVFLTYVFIAYTGNRYLKILLTFSYIVMLYVMDYIAMFICMSTGNTIQELLASPIAFTIMSVMSKLMAITFVFVIKKYVVSKKQKITVSHTEWIQLIIYSLSSFGVLYIVIDMAVLTGYSSIIAILVTLALGISNVIIFFVLFRLNEINETKQRNILLHQQVKIEMESVKSLSDAYAVQRSLSHDFNNHLSTINSLLESDNFDKAKEYVSSVSSKSFEKTILFSSNNSVVDVLLTQKYNIAKQNNINMQVKIDDLSALPMEDEDVVVVLSNLLDNAIEAASQCAVEKVVKVKFVEENDGYILSVHNTANNNFSYNGKDVVTTKEDKLSHGYGIKNIKTILEKYNYDYAVSSKDGKVSFTVLIG